jgi:hypothetical protein
VTNFLNEPGWSSQIAPQPLATRSEPEPLRGAVRLLEALGHGTLTEFPLKSGRRADIISLCGTGEIWIVEVKSGVADFRSDRKWEDYLEWCDRFFFAVSPGFPARIIPEAAGLMVAGRYDAVLIREPRPTPIAGARRKALTLRFALLASRRLPGLGA